MKTFKILLALSISALSFYVIAHDGHDHGNDRVKEILEKKRAERAEQKTEKEMAEGNHMMDNSQHTMNHNKDHMKTYSTKGVVQSFNTETGLVMIKHNPVEELNWPSMSMGFIVSDEKLKNQLKEASEIEFEFVQQGDDYVIKTVKSGL